jgi:hypothetical protein
MFICRLEIQGCDQDIKRTVRKFFAGILPGIAFYL